MTPTQFLAQLSRQSQWTSNSLNEGLSIKMARKKFQRKRKFFHQKDSRFNYRIIRKSVFLIGQAPILNKSENATLQLSLFYEKVFDKKYLLKLKNVTQTSSKRFVETPLICLVRCMSYASSQCKCLKLYSLKFTIAHAQIKIVMLIKIGLHCVA